MIFNAGIKILKIKKWLKPTSLDASSSSPLDVPGFDVESPLEGNLIPSDSRYSGGSWKFRSFKKFIFKALFSRNQYFYRVPLQNYKIEFSVFSGNKNANRSKQIVEILICLLLQGLDLIRHIFILHSPLLLRDRRLVIWARVRDVEFAVIWNIRLF